MNFTNILSDKQKKNLKNHYLIYKNSLFFSLDPVSFHDWLKFYVDNGQISILMYMANTKVKK